MMLEADPNAPYATTARIYAEAGWTGVLPLPVRKKNDPPKGYTGHDGAYPDEEQIDRWMRSNATGNIGLRLPAGMIGIDVDDYDSKTGGDTFRALKAAYGELPRTWTSTSRDDGMSGIRLYRLPEPTPLNDKPGPGIEIIQRHHRYIVAWPSIHPDTGNEYGWITPDGERSDRPPRPDEIPNLPDPWFQGLQAPKQRRVESLPFGGQAGVRWAKAVEAAFGRAMAEMSGGRHDATLHGSAGLVRLQNLGYPGAEDALGRLETAFLAAVSDGTRSDGEARAEWKRMLEGAEELVKATPSIIRPYLELVEELRNEDRSNHPAGGQRHSIKDKLPEPEPVEVEWEKPVPLGSITANLPTFPTHVFPAWIETQVQGVAEELQVPVDMPAMLALGALSTIAAGHVKVAVTTTWEEPVNLYLVTAMPPGAGKSPAAKKMLRPVQDYETELIEQARPLAARYEQEQRIREKAMKRAEDVGNKEEAAALLLEQETAEKVTIPQLTVDDATHEALVGMLDENHGRAAILSTEGGLFDIMASPRYNEATASNFQVYLKGFSGDWHKDRRVGRGATSIAEVTLTISLVTQPAVIAKLAAKPELAGVGLTARFMYSIPPDLVGWRNFVDARSLDPSVAERYRQQMLTLARYLGLHEAPTRLRLTAEAAEMYHRWHQDMEPRRRNKGDLKAVAEWSEKLRSCVVRVAGLLHLADGHDWDDIDVATLQRALEVAAYWLEHAKAVHDLWSGHPASQAALRVLDWLQETGQPTFTARSSYREGPLKSAQQARDTLELLEEHGWLRRVSGQFGKGGVPTPTFAVHPDVTQPATACHSPSEDVSGGCGRPVAQIGSATAPPLNDQVGPATDTEIQQDEVLCGSGVSGSKDTSEDSLFFLENERKRTPPATGATGATALSSEDGTATSQQHQPSAAERLDDVLDDAPRPCPVCGGDHPLGLCPAEL